MNTLLRDLRRILVLAALWTISGYLVGSALVAFGLDHYPFGMIIGSVNLIIGMLWLKGIISDPLGDRLFFEGPAPDEDGIYE